MTEPIAGWYPDPAGSGGRRYWNGTAWTDHLAPAPGAAPVMDAPAAAPTPAAAPVVDAPTSQPTQVMPERTPPPPPSFPPVQSPAQSVGQTPAWGAAPAPGLAPMAPNVVGDKHGPDGQVLSGWWRRAFGYLIDYGLITVVTLIAVGIVAALGFISLDTNGFQELLDKAEANPGYQPSQAEIQNLFTAFLPLVLWSTLVSLALGFINGVILVMRSGQTIGDRIVGNRKVTAGRVPPGFGAAFVRWIIPWVLSLISIIIPLIGWIPGVLTYLWPLWDSRKQTWQDKVASTVVENSNLAGPVNR